MNPELARDRMRTDLPQNFSDRSKKALNNEILQTALHGLKNGFAAKRKIAVHQLPEFAAISDYAVQVKDHTLNFLDHYLQQYENEVIASGGHVHWALNDNEACQHVITICKQVGARRLTKGKSMLSEEIGLNAALEAAGFDITETDLGEYIIQLRKEAPSHICCTTIHVTQNEVAEDFRLHHHDQLPNRDLSTPESLLAEARQICVKNFCRQMSASPAPIF